MRKGNINKKMKQLSRDIRNQIFSSALVRIAAFFLLFWFACRLFSSTFIQIQISPVVVSDDEPVPMIQEKSCNIFLGDWVQDFKGPRYTNATCSTIESPQDCMKNGRPDTDYLYWRWKPSECDLPKFDPRKFLNIMRGKSMALIGDSIMRNQVQSLLCMLSEVEEGIHVYHDEQYKNRRWSFPSYHFNLSVVWTPYLLKALTFEDDNGVSTGLTQLHLDELDTVWTNQYEEHDYILIAGGKWFLKHGIYYENNKLLGCHGCKDNKTEEMSFYRAYQKALNTTFKFISESKHKPYIIFRTTTPDHFENGEWNTGGYCNRTRPFKAGHKKLEDIDEVMRNVELEEFKMWKHGVNLHLLDTTWLSVLRPDGHPGVYRKFHPYDGIDKNEKLQNDCLHWCLPGPIDAWNDLILEMLIRESR